MQKTECKVLIFTGNNLGMHLCLATLSMNKINIINWIRV
jgi:hypothetical protein